MEGPERLHGPELCCTEGLIANIIRHLDLKMPPSVAPDDESTKVWVRRILREVLAGREDPEGFFALCLSVFGHQKTRSQYLSYIEPLSAANSSLHSVLASIYKDYFSKVKFAHGNIGIF